MDIRSLADLEKTTLLDDNFILNDAGKIMPVYVETDDIEFYPKNIIVIDKYGNIKSDIKEINMVEKSEHITYLLGDIDHLLEKNSMILQLVEEKQQISDEQLLSEIGMMAIVNGMFYDSGTRNYITYGMRLYNQTLVSLKSILCETETALAAEFAPLEPHELEVIIIELLGNISPILILGLSALIFRKGIDSFCMLESTSISQLQ